MRKGFFRDLVYNGDMEIRERLFRIILLVALIVSIFVILEGFLTDDTGIAAFLLCGLMAVMGISLFLTFKQNRTELASVIMGVYLICILFPAIFFISGGIESGTMVWFVLGILYVFLMFSGKRLVFFSILTVVIDVAVYVLGYLYPEAILPMSSRLAVYGDSLFSIFIVGFTGGAIFKFQILVFDNERKKNVEQTRQVEQISHYRESFFANISHEIRTPINTIIGLNEMTLREEISDEVAENALNIQNASKLLLSLVNDILDLSQLENQKMKILPVQYDTKRMFLELISFIHVQTQDKHLEFFVDIDGKLPSVLYGDERRIRQIMVNLLTNAVKYTKSGSITLSASADQIYKDTLKFRISVSDTGVGIRKEELETLYDSFRRVDERNHMRVEGSGLGLSIVKQLVDLMDGEITVDSIYTKGSVFTVTIEQKIVDASPIQSVVFVPTGKNKLRSSYRQSFEAPEARVLIVDDDELNLIVATKLLRATKVQVDTARGALACLELTKKKFYNVILLDHIMPDMDGIETLQEIRRQENGLCRETPVIALTATASAGSEKEYLDHGFDGYLAKPVDAGLLEAEVLRCIPEELVESRLDEEEDNSGTIQIVSARKRKRIYITSDCVCDLPKEYQQTYDIKLIYLYIRTEQGIFRDTKEIELNHLSKYLTDSTCTATAMAPPVEEYEAFFAEALTEADTVIHISLAEHCGKSYDNAVLAARGFGHVHVLDAGYVSGGQGLIVMYAALLAKEGRSVSEICQAVAQVRGRIAASFLLPSARIFCEKGYSSPATAKLFGLFHLHPGLTTRQSRLAIGGVYIGKIENAWKRYIWYHLLFKKRINTDIIYITHAGCSVKQQDLIVREVKKHVQFERIIIQKASVASSANAGIGAIGIAYMTK